MEKLNIEYVCTGNNGRSPMAEAIAQDYVHSKGLEDRVLVTSSGSGLHELTKPSGEKGKKQWIGIIELALKNGIYQESWRQEEARRVIDTGMDVDDMALDQCVFYAVNVEAMFRNMALFEIGLVAGGKYHKPTTTQAGRRVILPMAGSNTKQVETIYAQGDLPMPQIVPLNQYVGLEGDITNPFCQLLPVYQATRADLLKAVPMSVDKAVQEYL